MRVKAPFSTSDLNSWREEVKNFRKDPIKVSKLFEFIVRNQDPGWGDIDLMLTELTETEKALVIKTAKAYVQGEIASGALQGNVGMLFPITNPRWDLKDPGKYVSLTRYQEVVKFGFENAIPKTANWALMYKAKQGQQESPTDFVDRLRAAMQKITTLDPASEMKKQQLVSLMLGQSSPNIRQKRQKLKEPDNRNLEALMGEA